MKKACVLFGFGCSRSEVEAGRLVEYLKRNNWHLTREISGADLVLVGTCGVTRLVEELSVALVSKASKKKRPAARLVVFGCMPVMNEERLKKHFDVMTITPATMDRLDDVLGSAVGIGEVGDPNELDAYSGLIKDPLTACARLGLKLRVAAGNPSLAVTSRLLGRGPLPPNICMREAFSILIGRGCCNECSYCAIRRAIGPLVSKPIDEILAEFREGLEAGYRDFHLIAGDVGAYGQDIGTDISVLLRRLFEERGDFRLFIDEFNPRYFVEHFAALHDLLSSNGRRIGILTLPVQSGSARIVCLMNRHYSPERVRECLLRLKSASPGIVLGTHVLVGFPGETEEDFAETVSFLLAVSFSYVEAFRYEDRPGIPSALLPGKVGENEKRRRLWTLRRKFRCTCRLH